MTPSFILKMAFETDELIERSLYFICSTVITPIPVLTVKKKPDEKAVPGGRHSHRPPARRLRPGSGPGLHSGGRLSGDCQTGRGGRCDAHLEAGKRRGF